MPTAPLRPLFAACLVFVLAVPAWAASRAADPVFFPVTDYAASLEAAAAAERPLLVEFTTRKCGSCRQFAAALASDGTLGEAVRDLPTVKIPSWSRDGSWLTKKHRIVAFPTFLLVDARGREIDRWVGWEDAATWTGLVATALADLSLIPDKKLAFEEHPSAATAEILGRNAYWMGRPLEAVAYYEAAAQLAPERAHDFHYPVFRALSDRTLAAGDLPAIENAASLIASCAACTDGDQVRLGRGMIAVAAQLGDPQLAESWLKVVLDRTTGTTDPGVLRARAGFIAELEGMAEGD